MHKFKMPDDGMIRILRPLGQHTQHHYTQHADATAFRCGEAKCWICEIFERSRLGFFGRLWFDLKKWWGK